MKEVGFMKKATGVIAAAVAVLTVMPASEVQAQTSNTIFPAGWDRSVRDRMFMRLGAIYVNTQTKASDAVDLSGPVFSRDDLTRARDWIASTATNTDRRDQAIAAGVLLSGGNGGITRPAWNTLFNLPTTGLLRTANDPIPEVQVGGSGLGTPPGIKAKVGDSSTVALSMGYWLTDDFTWMLEAFLLAKPLDVKVYGAGTNASGLPNGLSGKHIVSTKMLPPLAVLSRHFGSPSSKVRPFVGLGATYAVLYDAKATAYYEDYVGGKTSVNIKNAFGVGPFIGLSGNLDESWHINLQVGQINLKTSATLTTRNTILSATSGVAYDFSPQMAETYATGGLQVSENILPLLSRLVALSRDGGNHEDLGTYTRKQDQRLRNTIVNVSVGYSF